MRAAHRLYVNADKTRIVPEDSEQAAFLLAAEGAELSDEDIKKYGLKKADLLSDEPETEAKAVDAPPENKSVKGPKKGK